MLRTVVWILLLSAGVVAVLAALIFTTPKLAVAAGIVSVVSWGAWGWVSSYYYGIRRHVVRHLGRRGHATAVLLGTGPGDYLESLDTGKFGAYRLGKTVGEVSVGRVTHVLEWKDRDAHRGRLRRTGSSRRLRVCSMPA